MIFCFGELLIDCLPEGNVIGGAPFNVAVHLNRFGSDVRMISRIGKGKFGDFVWNFLEQEQLTEGIQVDLDRPTGHVSVNFVNNEPEYTIHTNVAWQYIEFPEQLPTCDLFVFGSLATYFPKNKETLLKFKSALDCDFLCDLNLRDPFYDDEHILFCLEQTDILKVNEDEWNTLSNLLNSTLEALPAVLKERFNINRILLTKGAEGIDVYWDELFFQQEAVPFQKENFKDTVGAGDAFTSVVCCGLVNGTPLKKAVKKGAEFASLICQNKGAIPNSDAVYAM